MAATNYAACLAQVLAHEGGYANIPQDPGGATMRGVTQAVYDAYRKRRDMGVRSVRQISENELQDIYRRQYWNAVRGDDLPAGVDLAVFDYAVNSGPSRAAKALQMVIGLQPDGQIGERTLELARDRPASAIVNAICDRRMTFLKALKTWPTFGKGWARRVLDVRNAGLRMAGKPPQPAQDIVIPPAASVEDATPKAAPDPEAKPAGSGLDKVVSIGTGLAGVIATILTAVQSPWGVAALGLVLVAVCFLAWRVWPRVKMPELS